MDQIDKNIIARLQKNAREPVTTLAKNMGISRSTLRDRLERLERKGIIEAYTLRLNPEYQHRRIVAHAMLNLDPKLDELVVNNLQQMAGVQVVYSVSGEYDLVAELETDTTQDMDDLLDRIGNIKGVIRTTSSIILATKFSR